MATAMLFSTASRSSGQLEYRRLLGLLGVAPLDGLRGLVGFVNSLPHRQSKFVVAKHNEDPAGNVRVKVAGSAPPCAAVLRQNVAIMAVAADEVKSGRLGALLVLQVAAIPIHCLASHPGQLPQDLLTHGC